LGSTLAAAYLGQAGPRPGAAVGQAVTDRTFRVPAQRLAMAKAEAGGSAWAYDFRWAPHGAGRRLVMAFGEPSGVREDPLKLERTAWAQNLGRSE